MNTNKIFTLESDDDHPDHFMDAHKEKIHFHTVRPQSVKIQFKINKYKI